MKEYNAAIRDRLEIMDSDLSIQASKVPKWNQLSIKDDDPEFVEEFRRVIDEKTIPYSKDDQIHSHNKDSSLAPPINDGFLNMEVGLPRGDDDALMHAIVKKRKLDDNGLQIGTYHNNLLLDTRAYEVEYSDGTIKILTANIIAENLLAQVDEEGHRQLLLDEVVDH